MNSSANPNPYDPPSGDKPTAASSRIGLTFGWLGVLIGLAPSLYILYGLVGMWWQLATMPDSPPSIRPMGFSMAIFIAMGVGAVCCAPLCLGCSWVAQRLGSDSGAALAKSGATLFALPFLVGVGGIFLMCLFTGVELGS